MTNSLEEQLELLQSLYELQFDSSANLRDKLGASRRMRNVLTRCRRLRELIAKSLAKLETEYPNLS